MLLFLIALSVYSHTVQLNNVDAVKNVILKDQPMYNDEVTPTVDKTKIYHSYNCKTKVVVTDITDTSVAQCVDNGVFDFSSKSAKYVNYEFNGIQVDTVNLQSAGIKSSQVNNALFVNGQMSVCDFSDFQVEKSTFEDVTFKALTGRDVVIQNSKYHDGEIDSFLTQRTIILNTVFSDFSLKNVVFDYTNTTVQHVKALGENETSTDASNDTSSDTSNTVDSSEPSVVSSNVPESSSHVIDDSSHTQSSENSKVPTESSSESTSKSSATPSTSESSEEPAIVYTNQLKDVVFYDSEIEGFTYIEGSMTNVKFSEGKIKKFDILTSDINNMTVINSDIKKMTIKFSSIANSNIQTKEGEEIYFEQVLVKNCKFDIDGKEKSQFTHTHFVNTEINGVLLKDEEGDYEIDDGKFGKIEKDDSKSNDATVFSVVIIVLALYIILVVAAVVGAIYWIKSKGSNSAKDDGYTLAK
ncbi:hypothetical protein EIN_087980 [Entamoeba invadens IP1]|uniref:hypothetical protein n=1 Tax=Entamoeba invadens IP1 TaxID=370355 RepID=UPI0002C3E670|nr:hypothetical protein EIN_087980 [Entamoeba invadens IP1]ELP85456.1 hypothetical protein EIN_087980 [Entamoeba invadens IP1]|eukprot:XP_004184802.1 hypothetical protein EIN_087980 [Entamoeba invadens IP1]